MKSEKDTGKNTSNDTFFAIFSVLLVKILRGIKD